MPRNVVAPNPSVAYPKPIMLHTGIKGHKVKQALLSLCSTLLDGNQFTDANQKIEAFLADDSAKQLYIDLTSLRAQLQQRQQRGFELTAGEVAKLEKIQAEADANPTVKDFAEASEELNQIKAAVVAYLEKSFEICRPPSDEDFAEDPSS